MIFWLNTSLELTEEKEIPREDIKCSFWKFGFFQGLWLRTDRVPTTKIGKQRFELWWAGRKPAILTTRWHPHTIQSIIEYYNNDRIYCFTYTFSKNLSPSSLQAPILSTEQATLCIKYRRLQRFLNTSRNLRSSYWVWSIHKGARQCTVTCNFISKAWYPWFSTYHLQILLGNTTSRGLLASLQPSTLILDVLHDYPSDDYCLFHLTSVWRGIPPL